MKSLKLVVLIISVAVSAPCIAFTKNNQTCDIAPGRTLLNHGGEALGPYNYKSSDDQHKVNTVLDNHFTSRVERLIVGQSTSDVEADLDFTLRAIPDYPRALAAMSKFYVREFSQKSITNFESFARQNNYYTPECYFKRAMYYSSQDPKVSYLYAIFLHKMENLNEAENFYLLALEGMPEHPEISYNLGLLYVDSGELKKARKYADLAYAANFPLQGLKNKLAAAEQQTN